MRDYRDAKAMAHAMKEQLSLQGVEIPLNQALEVVAKQFGQPTWNVLSAKIDQGPKSVDESLGAISFEQAIPIVRIFDVAQAHEYYVGYLGFKVDWEHRFGARFPLYEQVSRGDLKLHLSEHSGDATPGGNMCVYMTGIREFHDELMSKPYGRLRPGLEDEGGRLEIEVIDPFNNHIRFMENKA